MTDSAIVVEDLSKRYLIGHRTSSGGYGTTTLRENIRREIGNFARKGIDFIRGRQVIQGDEIYLLGGETGGGVVEGEYPVTCTFPPGVPNNYAVELPLDRLGIRNFYLTVIFKVNEKF